MMTKFQIGALVKANDKYSRFIRPQQVNLEDIIIILPQYGLMEGYFRGFNVMTNQSNIYREDELEIYE